MSDWTEEVTRWANILDQVFDGLSKDATDLSSARIDVLTVLAEMRYALRVMP